MSFGLFIFPSSFSPFLLLLVCFLATCTPSSLPLHTLHNLCGLCTRAYTRGTVFFPPILRYALLALPLVNVFAPQSTVVIAGGLAKLHDVGIFTKAWAVASADRVMEQLSESDAALHAHVVSATSKGGLEYAEFLQKVAIGGKERSAMEGVEALQSPTIFLRKWIGDAFVGILREAAALFAWDQCMLVGWHTFEDISVVLILLLRKELMAAAQYAEVGTDCTHCKYMCACVRVYA